MLCRVESKRFLNALNMLCSNKQVINFYIEGNELLLESFEPIIVSVTIDLINVSKQFDSDTYTSISVEMNGSYNLLSEEGVILLSIGKDVLTIKSDDYDCRFKSVYEDRFTIPTEYSNTFVGLDNSDNLDNIVRLSQYMSTFSRAIQVEEPGVIISEKTAYMICGPIALKTSLNFPDSVWARQVLRSLNAIFKVNRIDNPTLKVNDKSGVYGIINITNKCDVAFSMRFIQNTQIDSINSVIKGLRKLCTIDIAYLSDKVRIIEKVYKKAEVKLAVGEGTYFVVVRVGTESEMTCGRINQSNKIYMIDSSIPMLSLINNIFNKSNGVEVYGGGRYVLFKDSRNTLLTTGLIEA